MAPDGETVIGLEDGLRWRRYYVSADAVADVRGIAPGERPVGWSSDGRALIVAAGPIPRRLDRVDLATGQRTLIREVRPPGLESRRVTIRSASADGQQFAYSGVRREHTLYVVKGVR